MNENKSIFDRLKSWIKTSVSLRLFTIGFLVLLLLIPVSMVEELIRERENYQGSVTNEVSDKWGQHQTMSALFLSIPYYTLNTIEGKEGANKLVKTKRYAYFLPAKLDISGHLSPEIRYRNIYEVVVYNCNLNISGYFEKPNFKKLNINETDVVWEQAHISLGLTDLRSIKNSVYIQWLDDKINFDPGIKNNDIISSGIHAPVGINPSSDKHSFSLSIDFNGSNGILFTPLGKTTHVELTSDWSNPSFEGAFLPDSRTVSDTGFTAAWQVLHLNRNYPQEFTGNSYKIEPSNFGVNLIIPVDEYQKSMRAVKYAIMLISLTFLVYFFSQIKNHVNIHPIQYLLVGLALCLFFTLLLAFSEYIYFGYAFLIGSVATIGLVTGYSYFIFKNKRLTQILSGVLLFLYGFIYIIIQLQNYALLIGSIGLFVILCVVMYIARNIDWYNTTQASEKAKK